MSYWRPPVFKRRVKNLYESQWGWVVSYLEGLSLAPGTDIGFGTYIQAKAGVTIETGVQIGSHCSIYSVSTIGERKGKVTLRKGCQIGSHTVIMPGVTVGEYAIVGAHSYIDKDVPDHTKLVPQHSFRTARISVL